MIVGLLGTAAILTAVAVGGNMLRDWRIRKKRRAQLRSLAFEHGMKLLGEEEHDLLESEMSVVESSAGELELVGVMDGQDGAGHYALGYRNCRGRGQHFFQFALEGLGMPTGLRLEPEGRRDPRPWWVQKLRPRRTRIRGARMELRWITDPGSMQEDARMKKAMSWAKELARGSSASAALPLGFAVDRSCVTIHSLEPLDDSRLASFYERAMRLRRLMTSGSGASPARRTVQTQAVSQKKRQQLRQQREDTRPLPRVESAPADEDTKVVDITVTQLLREMPRPKQNDEFEVPEPTQEVRVIRAR